MSARPLTARGVRMMLTRAGVDSSRLVITDDPAVWTDLETGKRSTSVVIKGPEDDRWQATLALYARGLSNAPYPDYEMWSRR